MGQTIIEKIIAGRTDDPVAPGATVWVDIDVRSARDFGGANVVRQLEANCPHEPVADVARTCFTFDCVVPANTIAYANNQHRCRRFAREHGVPVYDAECGIGSHVLIEEGRAVPGAIVVGTDSHLNLLGAVGAFGQGMGDRDIAFAFHHGRTWFEVPETMRIDIVGELPRGASARDLTLLVVGTLGARGALGRAVEFYGPAIDALGLSGRITLASMATEMGAIAALIPPNEAVLAYCRARAGDDSLRAVRADDDANYCETREIDLAGLTPLVARPGRPDDVVPVAEVPPTRIDTVFIGSCTNGSFDDLATVARLVQGRRVAEGVQARVVPATREVYAQMLATGMLGELFAAGFNITSPGCGGCAAGQVGMTGEQEVQVSTSNRNFHGKQGAGDTWLASPATAAASAVLGRLATAAELEGA